MSRKEELEELKKLCHPALQYAELVELARNNSPSKAQELATGRWPRRQARACRFLAMIRRDYRDVFDQLVTPPEHARPDGPVRSTLEESSNERTKCR